MNDLISRQAAYDTLTEYYHQKTEVQHKSLKEALSRVPTIDPVKHGKWIEYPIADGMNQCSVCGVLRFGDSSYCPNCGAKMDGGKDDQEG